MTFDKHLLATSTKKNVKHGSSESHNLIIYRSKHALIVRATDCGTIITAVLVLNDGY